MNILLLNVLDKLRTSVGPGSFDYSSRLSSIKFNIEDIPKIIKFVNVKKAHGHDVISLRKIKLCCQSILRLLSYSKILLVMLFFLIFGRNPVLFLSNKWQQIINRSLAIIEQYLFYKFVAKFVAKIAFQFLHDNNLLSPHQSGFRAWDSREYHLFSIVHDINAPLDCYPSLEVRGIFLDISKAFDWVWLRA